ncbi:nitrogen permease regulator of amino acid transport activity 3-domain-containing protein [Umbelopsis sp. PMI_123]|nr:nitrogen permease regulator of amino acid transport activity 3-domain-containing protein [Umbelopsis sp. PMI_123]
MLSILAESSLARDIKHIFTSLSSNSIAHVIVNDFIDLSLQLPVVGKQQKLSMMLQYPGATNPVNESVASIYVGAYEYDKYPVLCPYHTLLLLEDPEEVLKSMPLDSNPTLVQLAKLIHPIHARNVYAISPVAKMDNFKELEADFKSHVPGLDLPTLLSELSSTRPLYMITPSKELRQQYCVAIMYLLRFDLVIQLHMYMVLLPIPKETSTSTTTSDDQLGSSPGDDWLKRFASDKAPREVADLFQRLVPYLNGRHPMDEIVFREGITRKQLTLVLKYYADYIVTMYHYANY